MPDIYSLPTTDWSMPNFPRNPRADALLKEASRLESEGDLAEAIRALEAAESAIQDGTTIYSVSTLVRLPMYLQKAGRGEEAVIKLFKLLESYPAGWGEPLRRDRHGMYLLHFERQRGDVYDKLRLVLQRDERYADAMPHAVLAQTYSERIAYRVYMQLVKKWKGKPEPDSSSKSFFAWHAFKEVEEIIGDQLEVPELSSVKSLLKKLKQPERLPEFQRYAHQLLADFKKPDMQVITEVRQMVAAGG